MYRNHWSLKQLFVHRPVLTTSVQEPQTQQQTQKQKQTTKKKSPTSKQKHTPLTQTPTQAQAQPQPQPQEKPKPPPSKRRKATIPVAFREQIWIRDCGKVFEAKCPTVWCQNRLTVFDFQSGHNIPESKGGPTKPENLLPLCSRCNQSMGDRYTFDEWSALAPASKPDQQQEQEQQSQSQVALAPLPRRWCLWY